MIDAEKTVETDNSFAGNISKKLRACVIPQR